MRLISRLVGAIVILLLTISAGLVLLAQDANRLKPELEALIAANSDYRVEIQGDVRWQLFPPLILHVAGLQGQNAERTIEIANLELKVDLSAIWQDIDRWRISELIITSAALHEAERKTLIDHLRLNDFSFGEPAGLTLSVRLPASDAAEPIGINVTGQVTYDPATESTPQRVVLQQMQILSNPLDAQCNALLTEVLIPADTYAARSTIDKSEQDQLLPLDLLRRFEATAQCNFSRLALQQETFTGGTLDATNVAGKVDVLINQPDFFGGTLQAEASIDYTGQPVRWAVLPKLDQVETQRLLDWQNRDPSWAAALQLIGEATMTGNSPRELLNSLQADNDFTTGQGELNITPLKQQLLKIALLANRTEGVQGWPETLQYETFVGSWNIRGRNHAVELKLDNLHIAGDGEYNPFEDQLNMLTHITIKEASEESPFRINPMLQDTPIPVRCKGPIADPQCRLDEDGAKALIATALTGEADNGLRRKLEEKIDEEVPEKFRGVARDLLDILGRALQ